MTRSLLSTCFVVLCTATPSCTSELLAADIDYDTARFDRRLAAVRAAGPIVVDGDLGDSAWADAPLATKFIQNEPREGEPASEETEVRVLYDDDTLYIGVFAHDSQPSGIIVNELKKDFDVFQSDGFQVVIDTFHDERNGYQFAVNPMGAKWDAQMVNEGRDVNTNWDGIWTVRTRIVEQGWYAEIAIPFRTLRFPNSSPQTWGVNFLRRLRHRNEDSFWSPLPRIDRLTRVSMAGTLEGLQGVHAGSDLRVKPYVSTAATRLAGGANQGDADAGFDVKYGVTTGLTWDFTVNTDFSQVEADEQQINLTRFSLLFPEKRDFFLENSGVFQFGPGSDRMPGGGGGGAGGGGRQNSQNDVILFFSRQIGLDNGKEIPIIAGTRLTGRAGGFSIGVLNIQQSRRPDNPTTNFTALRLRRNVLANSDIGVMVLNKDANGPRYNRIAGADANFRFYRNLNLNAYVAKTASPEAVVAGAGRDFSTRAGANWRDDSWEFRGAYTTIGERFHDELGFVPRTGINRGEAFVGAHVRPTITRGWLRDIFPHWQLVNVSRASGGFDSRYIDYHLPFNFQNGAFLEVGLNPNLEDLVEPFLINSRRNITIDPGRYAFNEWFVLLNTNQAAAVSFTSRYSVGEFYDGYKHGYQFGTTTRMNERLNLSVNLSRNDISLSRGHYATTLIASRVNYSFSTRMFLNSLVQYNTDARQWSSNIRFNIIHRPLSDFFLVYNERRDSRSNDLMDRAVVAKMTYLVAF